MSAVGASELKMLEGAIAGGVVRGAREGSASHHGDTGAQDFRCGQKERTRRRPIAAIIDLSE